MGDRLRELSEEELALVGGGTCGCALIGLLKGCVCVFYGSQTAMDADDNGGKRIGAGGSLMKNWR